jgi:cytidyltransferase-like protein
MKEEREHATMMKPYKVGYCPGAFDLFHIGHLNLLRRSKERCEYLIAGVVTDEVYEGYKWKMPCISFEERFAIVDAIEYVDQTIGVTQELMSKVTAWHRFHYDCHFAGSDHAGAWPDLEAFLHSVGSNMEFFDYTQSTSSTRIRQIIEQEALFHYIVKDIADKTIVTFGAGDVFREYMQKYGQQYRPVFGVDNNPDKWEREIEGVLIRKPEALRLIPPKDLWVILTTKQVDAVRQQLEKYGINEYKVYYPGRKVFQPKVGVI